MSDFCQIEAHACTQCGFAFAPSDPLPIVRRCPKGSNPVRALDETLACVHRGELLRWQSCPGCCGSVRLKILACAVHGQCTLGKQIEGVKCCNWCGDRLTSAPQTA